MTEAPYTPDDDGGPPALPSALRGGTLAWMAAVRVDDRIDDVIDYAILCTLAEALGAPGTPNENRCWASIATIATRSRVAPRTVRRRLVALVERGLLARVRLRDGYARPSIYAYELLPNLGTTSATPGDSRVASEATLAESVPVPSDSRVASEGARVASSGRAYPPTRSEDQTRGSTSGRAGDNSAPRHRPVEEVLAERPPVDRDLNLTGVARLRSQFGPQPNEPRPGPECSLALEHEA